MLIIRESTLLLVTSKFVGLLYSPLLSQAQADKMNNHTEKEDFLKKIGWDFSVTSALNFFLDHFFLMLHDINSTH